MKNRMNYATYQFKKFRTEVGDVDALEPKACQILRTQAKERFGCRERSICKWYGGRNERMTMVH